MSNRTDWPELAEELTEVIADAVRLDRHAISAFIDIRDRLESELHNAFVASQEHENRDLAAALAEALDAWKRHSFRSKMVGGPSESIDKARIDELRAKFGVKPR